MKIMHVVGARPNFMKAAPVMSALDQTGLAEQILVHTGQHYDDNMSDIFFRQLGLPKPDINLEVGSGSHTVQTAQVMMRFEEVVLAHQPDTVLVYGDVNSTLAASLVCAKSNIFLGHVEAGLRSFDRNMPEELNRLVTDQLADILFTPSMDGNENLLREGVSQQKTFLVGNVMIDTLVRLLPQARRPDLSNLEEKFALVTLHRPSNVDLPESLTAIWGALQEISQELQVVFPVHPRTRARLAALVLGDSENANILLAEPLGYLEFLYLQKHAAVIVTDSGGIQEESTYLGVPCLTLRENTERPITVTMGTNTLIGQNPGRLCTEVDKILRNGHKKGLVPPLWDGEASKRIADILVGQKSIAPGCEELQCRDKSLK